MMEDSKEETKEGEKFAWSKERRELWKGRGRRIKRGDWEEGKEEGEGTKREGWMEEVTQGGDFKGRRTKQIRRGIR